MGILFLTFGGFLGVFTVADAIFPGGAETIWSKLLGTPRSFGIFLLAVGAIAIMYGVIRVLAGTALLGSGLGATVSNFLERIWGGLVLILGLVFAGLGLVRSFRRRLCSLRSTTFSKAFRRRQFRRRRVRIERRSGGVA